jgi:hypothetical protein
MIIYQQFVMTDKDFQFVYSCFHLAFDETLSFELSIDILAQFGATTLAMVAEY